MSFIILLFIVIAIASFMWRLSRGQSLLDQWASENGFEILNSERRSMMRGPFFLTTGKGQEVYYVTVRDAAGNERNAYLRVGGKMLGMMSDNVDVRWEDPPPKS